MPAIPVAQYGTVTGKFLAAVADGGDENDVLPEGLPLSGQVQFTPSVKSVIIKSATPPVTVIPATIVADLDSDGFLSLNGVQGVTLLATDDPAMNPSGFTYLVEFVNLWYVDEDSNAYPVEYKSFSIKVPKGTTTDLAVVAPIPADTGAVVVSNEVAVMQARDDTFAARDAALNASKITVTTGSVNAVGDLILTRTNGTTVTAGRVKGDSGDVAPVVTNGTANGTYDLAAAKNGAVTYRLLLTGNLTMTLPTPTLTTSWTVSVRFQQDNSATPRIVTWPANVKWPYGSKPTLSTAPNAIDLVHFMWVGNEWYGFVGGQAFAS